MSAVSFRATSLTSTPSATLKMESEHDYLVRLWHELSSEEDKPSCLAKIYLRYGLSPRAVAYLTGTSGEALTRHLTARRFISSESLA